jgi:hypothetical protein
VNAVSIENMIKLLFLMMVIIRAFRFQAWMQLVSYAPVALKNHLIVITDTKCRQVVVVVAVIVAITKPGKRMLIVNIMLYVIENYMINAYF